MRSHLYAWATRLLLALALHACGTGEKITETVLSAEEKWKEQAMQQRRAMCDAAQGMFADVDVAACTNSQTQVQVQNEPPQTQACVSGEATHYEGQCLQRDPSGLFYFNDGPSVPYAFLNVGQDLGEGANLSTWNEFFWQAGVNHDYCYHHGQATYNYAQTDCDNQLLDDLVALCSQKDNISFPWFSKARCTVNAQIIYASVRAMGEPNFQRMSTRVQYPAYVPLWQVLGFSQKPDDPALRAAIDKVT